MLTYKPKLIDELKLTKNYFEGRKIILLDRDGIINEKAKKGRYITNLKDFIFLYNY